MDQDKFQRDVLALAFAALPAHISALMAEGAGNQTYMEQALGRAVFDAVMVLGGMDETPIPIVGMRGGQFGTIGYSLEAGRFEVRVASPSTPPGEDPNEEELPSNVLSYFAARTFDQR